MSTPSIRAAGYIHVTARAPENVKPQAEHLEMIASLMNLELNTIFFDVTNDHSSEQPGLGQAIIALEKAEYDALVVADRAVLSKDCNGYRNLAMKFFLAGGHGLYGPWPTCIPVGTTPRNLAVKTIIGMLASTFIILLAVGSFYFSGVLSAAILVPLIGMLIAYSIIATLNDFRGLSLHNIHWLGYGLDVVLLLVPVALLHTWKGQHASLTFIVSLALSLTLYAAYDPLIEDFPGSALRRMLNQSLLAFSGINLMVSPFAFDALLPTGGAGATNGFYVNCAIAVLLFVFASFATRIEPKVALFVRVLPNPLRRLPGEVRSPLAAWAASLVGVVLVFGSSYHILTHLGLLSFEGKGALNFTDSVYTSFLIVSTLGGNPQPTSVIGKLLVMLEASIGLFLLAIYLGLVMSRVSQRDK
jgi:hypothetical protein